MKDLIKLLVAFSVLIPLFAIAGIYSYGQWMQLSAEKTTVTTTTTIDSGKDDEIVASIYNKYAQSSALIGTAITATSNNGVVTLTGSVTAQSQADEAVSAAKSIQGVKDVISNINVTTGPKPTPLKVTPKY